MLTFAGVDGETQTISITVNGDVDVEDPKTFLVQLSNIQGDAGVTFATQQATGTITNDDIDPASFTLISDIQGTGLASAYDGQNVVVSAVVTQITETGFFLQEEMADYDSDDLTSEGIFVYTGATDWNVAVGDLVAVEGTVDEYYDLTELTSITGVVQMGAVSLPDYTVVTLPFASSTTLEQYEGMLVDIQSGTSDALTVSDNYSLGRYGQITISAGLLYTPTQLFDAQTEQAEIEALLEAYALNQLIIDDGVSAQNPTELPYIANNTAGDNGNGYLDIGDDLSFGGTIRLGAELSNGVQGALTFQFDSYMLLPADTLDVDEATNNGARETTPEDVGGTLQVASFNVLNYFTTLGSRGADNAAEFERQEAKIVSAILASGADVIGLEEIENNGFGSESAIQSLIDALNETSGTNDWVFVDPTGTGSQIGTDAITTGVIYNSSLVQLVSSAYHVFDEDSLADLEANTGLNYTQLTRPAIAATFMEIASGESFTIAVNHFKSKGDSGLDAFNASVDPNVDQGDGQGYWNQIRVDAALELAEWLATDPTGSGDPDYLILGDLNAYAEEDPIQALVEAGYTDLARALIGDDAYSYLFGGMVGTLDYAMANDSLMSQITGVTEWHINAAEPGLLDYDTYYNDEAWYADDMFRASDNDPIIIGLDLSSEEDPVLVAARINELHYDNAGTDEGEFVEVRVAAGTDVADYLVTLYNGNNGGSYSETSLSTATMTTDGTFDYYVVDGVGIQNGAPDGVALSNAGGLIEFLSYEGTFTASGGAADGVLSTDIGAAEDSSTAIGDSLQRQDDDSWVAAAQTAGAENTAPAASASFAASSAESSNVYALPESSYDGGASFYLPEQTSGAMNATLTALDEVPTSDLAWAELVDGFFGVSDDDLFIL